MEIAVFAVPPRGRGSGSGKPLSRKRDDALTRGPGFGESGMRSFRKALGAGWLLVGAALMPGLRADEAAPPVRFDTSEAPEAAA